MLQYFVGVKIPAGSATPLGGKQVPVMEPFRLYNGRVKLMYPRDPSGPPGETINCGCSWIIVPKSLAEAMT